MASCELNAVDTITVSCKDDAGNLYNQTSVVDQRASHMSASTHRPFPSGGQHSHENPLSRIAELFNTNHFLVVRSVPSIIPALDPLYRSTKAVSRLWHPIRRLFLLEIQHRLRQALMLDLIPTEVRGLLMDEAGAPGETFTIAPAYGFGEIMRLFRGGVTGSQRSVEHRILEGERSVWPVVKALRVRCAIEFELERTYQRVRRRKPMDAADCASGVSFDT